MAMLGNQSMASVISFDVCAQPSIACTTSTAISARKDAIEMVWSCISTTAVQYSTERNNVPKHCREFFFLNSPLPKKNAHIRDE